MCGPPGDADDRALILIVEVGDPVLIESGAGPIRLAPKSSLISTGPKLARSKLGFVNSTRTVFVLPLTISVGGEPTNLISGKATTLTLLFWGVPVSTLLLSMLKVRFGVIVMVPDGIMPVPSNSISTNLLPFGIVGVVGVYRIFDEIDDGLNDISNSTSLNGLFETY